MDEDFVGEYDFLYLPIDFKNRQTLACVSKFWSDRRGV